MSTRSVSVAIVTGAGHGVGAAVVRRLAARHFAVAAVDLRESWCADTLDTVAEGRAAVGAFGADLGFLHEAEATVLRVVESLGPPSVVVNVPQHFRAAGFARCRSEEGDWDAVIRAWLRAPLLLSRAAQRHLAESRRSRIVNVAPPPLTSPPDVTELVARAGLDAVTRTLARELEPYGVAVSAVAAESGDDEPATAQDAAESGQAPPAGEDHAETLASVVEFLVCDADAAAAGQRLAPAPFRRR